MAMRPISIAAELQTQPDIAEFVPAAAVRLTASALPAFVRITCALNNRLSLQLVL